MVLVTFRRPFWLPRCPFLKLEGGTFRVPGTIFGVWTPLHFRDAVTFGRRYIWAPLHLSAVTFGRRHISTPLHLGAVTFGRRYIGGMPIHMDAVTFNGRPLHLRDAVILGRRYIWAPLHLDAVTFGRRYITSLTSGSSL